MLSQLGADAAIYAGGTELLVLMKERLAHFSHLIDIKPIPGLAGISLDDAGGSISIGPLASHRSIETSQLIRTYAPIVAEVESQVANIRVRHTGTLGGNLCFAEPHSDPATLLVALDAALTLTSSNSKREVPAGEFFTGLLETVRQPDELLTSIAFDLLPGNAGSAYCRFKTHERPTATIAAVLWLENGSIADSRLVAGSVGNRPQRLTEAEALLSGQAPAPDLFGTVRNAAMNQVEIEQEGFESVDYKRHLIGVLSEQALNQALERAA
ncbi:xanthine dehydrogenase family protein subunit M [soil metagenome]